MSDARASAPRARAAFGETSLIPDLGFWTKSGQSALDSWVQSSETLAKGALELAQEVFNFGQARIQSDIETWKALLGCHDLGEVVACQTKFAEKVTAQYQDEAAKITTRLTTLWTRAANTHHEKPAHTMHT